MRSARVMRDDAGLSRGFGFVSFQTPQEGMFIVFRPLDIMLVCSPTVSRPPTGSPCRSFCHGWLVYEPIRFLTIPLFLYSVFLFPGMLIGNKRMTVRLHEPKQLRAEKLAEQRAKGSPGSPKAGYREPPSPGLNEGQTQGLGLRLGLGLGGTDQPTSKNSGYLETVSRPRRIGGLLSR